MKTLAAHTGPSQKFEIALFASLVLNAIVWCVVAASVQYKVAPPPRPLEFQRVIIDKKGRTVPKVVKGIIPPKPKPKPPPPQPRHEVQPRPKPPETAHNRVLTSKAPGPPKPSDFQALAGGNAKLGAPTDRQGTGNAVVEPPKPPVEEPKPTPVEQPKAPPVQPAPAPVENPKPTPPPPPPPPPPKPKGESKEAEAVRKVDVQIPDDLKTQSFKSYVRVRVTISADGSFNVFLRTSSGNQEVDKLVMDALNQWKWKPALKDGDPVDSVQSFRFEFEIK